MTEYLPQPGDYGVVKTTGIIGLLIRIGTLSHWNHAIVYVGGGHIVEANPTGIEVSPVSKYSKIVWNRHDNIDSETRAAIVTNALSKVGAPYGFIDIAVIAFRILGLRALANVPFIKNLAQREGYICSELVAECYHETGVVLVDKPDYLVTPSDLAERLLFI
jgi:uncharacterized protein YycO